MITVFENLIGIGSRPSVTTRDEETGGGVLPSIIPSGDLFLLEDGSPFLLEDGTNFLLETAP